MPTDCITYQDSGYFTPLVIDYLNERPELRTLYNRFPKIGNFKEQMAEKTRNYPAPTRAVLAEELLRQYAGMEISDATSANIALLQKPGTFTVTTGHQLNLFTGPLYFLYKIVSTINLCRELKQAHPENDFVPVYWMASEDHDFDEINHFYFKGKKISWDRRSAGPVGRLSTDGLDAVLAAFEKELNSGHNAEFLKNLFLKAYGQDNLAQATRCLANELFRDQGLVIIDGDSVALKKLFAPYVKEELLHQRSFENVNRANAHLSGYKIQVNPREINLFYIEDGLRERIVFENGRYLVNNTPFSFTQGEILTQLEKNPEKFSPNVILRPLYQEVILPNLAYIGGGGELAYWLELQSNFEANGIVFPMLLLRNSVLLATQKQAGKADKLGLTWGDLFLKQQQLVDARTRAFSAFELDFSPLKIQLAHQFEALGKIATQTDPSFLGAVKAQQAKQTKGLDNLEKRLLKAEKRMHADKIQRITDLQDALFPNQSLQERKANFSEFYEAYGEGFIRKLFEELQPLRQEFSIVVL